MAVKPTYEELKQRVEVLESQSVRQKRLEIFHKTLFQISSDLEISSTYDELFAMLHTALKPLIDVNNLLIALYDEAEDSITFPYIVDSINKCSLPVIESSITSSLTAQVIKTKRPLLMKKADIEKRFQECELPPSCTPPEVWLGVPLKTRDRLLGVIAVQHYYDADCYDRIDMEILISVADQVVLALEHFTAVKELQESDIRYRTLIDLAVTGILLGSPDGIITEANLYMCELLMLPREDLVGVHISQLPFTTESLKKSPLRFDLVHSGEKVICQRTIVLPDGSEREVLMKTRLMPDNSYQAIFSDITAQQRMERELRESEERFKALHNASFCGIVIHDQGVILDCNQGLADMTGYTIEELVGMNALELIASGWLDLVVKNIKSGFEQLYEVEGVRKDNSRYPLSIRGTLIPYKGKTVRVAEFRDITDRKHAESEKLRLEEQLFKAQKMEMIGTLAGGVAHDLNNILSGIVSYPDLLLQKISDNDKLRKPLQTIKESGEKASVIVQDLLTLARRGVTVKEKVNLNNIITNYLHSPEHKKLITEYKNISIISSCANDLLPVSGSPVHLAQTITNLVTNAVESMEKGGQVFIQTQNRYIDLPFQNYDTIQEGDYAVIVIRDQGHGIGSEEINKIFEPFYTRKKMGKSGTGLGMAVVWGTIKDHNGYISCESQIGAGTTFTLFLPVSTHFLEDEQVKTSIEDIYGNNESILVVDDILEQREIASAILTELGYRVTVATSGEEALLCAKKETFDLVLLDMVLGEGMDGLDTFRAIREINPGQKAIITSGFSETDRIAETIRLGAGKYVKKPYMIYEIGIAIKKELQHKRV